MYSCLLCSQGRPRIINGHLIITGPSRRPFGRSQQQLYRLLPIPTWFNRLASEASTVLEVRCPVRIAFVESTGGMGPFYVLGLGLIIIGRDDIEQIIDRIMTTILRPLSDAEAQIMALVDPERLVSRSDLRDVVRLCVVAHEIGHALAFENEVAFASPLAAELYADYCAGFVAGSLLVKRELCRIMFESIGCHGPLCTHPSPARRARAFMIGYSEGSSASAEAFFKDRLLYS